jgi:succinate dehydrogenase/fumarate reductase flavoprotein subunit
MSQDVKADVVVVGGGGAGLAAAIEAASAGCKVVLLERAERLGGTTAWAVGSVTANRTPHQRRAGIEDGPEAHAHDMSLFAGDLAGRDNLELQRIFADKVTETFEWLLDMGLVFLGPMPEPPHRVPRMHNIVPNARAFPYQMGRRCRALGVDIRVSMRAENVLIEEGRAAGIAAIDSKGVVWRFHATRGVILSTGDFSGGEEFKRKYISEDAAATSALTETSSGDGHRMALALGGDIVNGDVVWGPMLRFVPPPVKGLIHSLPPNRVVGLAAKFAFEMLPQWLLRPFLMSFVTTILGPESSLYREGAVLVNKLGRRFTDELANPAIALIHEPDQIAYVVMNGETAAKFETWPSYISTAPGVAYAYLADYRRNRGDIYFQEPTVPALAARLGMQANELALSVKDGAGPYVALGPVRPYVMITDGGLRVTNRLQVVGEDERPIPGLFAAGSTGQGGLLLFGHGHHLAWAFVSGRLAGRNVTEAN